MPLNDIVKVDVAWEATVGAGEAAADAYDRALIKAERVKAGIRFERYKAAVERGTFIALEGYFPKPTIDACVAKIHAALDEEFESLWAELPDLDQGRCYKDTIFFNDVTFGPPDLELYPATRRLVNRLAFFTEVSRQPGQSDDALRAEMKSSLAATGSGEGVTPPLPSPDPMTVVMKCDCGGEAARTSHSSWCSLSKVVVA